MTNTDPAQRGATSYNWKKIQSFDAKSALEATVIRGPLFRRFGSKMMNSKDENLVDRHEGFDILKADDGYYWENGGYHDTIQECRLDIEDWNAGELQHDPDWPPYDTPSLPDPWWAYA